MASSKWETRIILVAQMGVGILGNTSLFCLCNFTLFTGQKVRCTDIILSQLALANSLVLFSKGIPHTMAAFGSKYFLNEVGCQFVFYFHRVARGVGLSITSLLSGFQAIRLCPNFSRWMEHRMRSSKCIGFCCFLCWILHLSVNIFVPFRITGPTHSKNLSVNTNYGYCCALNPDRFMMLLVVVIFSTVDLTFLGLMTWASGSMVLVLHRHKQRVQHIHSNSHSLRPSPEARATRTILILASSYFSTYSLSSLLSLWMALFVIPGQWVLDTSIVLSLCFPTFSPFVLICSDTRVTAKIVLFHLPGRENTFC
ncbi:vomeronasal type-1 receptor 1-like [Equus asinus]|uniref:Vomeronasal type-1 receptor n=1 Tax=Equus asinus TaxID=9793 RepID=A0A9L0JMW7_EQUAS|nr:vomeronasal type-1 receptor 1-like [Equus asinus]